jgi:hypothetical protein
MSFRHTFITEFLYRYKDGEQEPQEVRQALEKYASSVFWNGRDGMGYYYGVIKDLNGSDSKKEDKQLKEELAKVNCRIEVIYE